LYLIDGDPGTGKTTLAIQFLLEGIARGEKCLYITLSETKEELTAGAKSHGWSVENIKILEIVSTEEDLQGDSQVTMYHPSEVELTETTRRVLAAVEAVNPSRVHRSIAG
jgi:circadian clock protein KaiC